MFSGELYLVLLKGDQVLRCVWGLTADGAPQVQPHGALQRLVGTTKSVEEEEAGGHGGEEDHHTTEEDDGDVEACGDHAQEVWEDWDRKEQKKIRGQTGSDGSLEPLPVPPNNKEITMTTSDYFKVKLFTIRAWICHGSDWFCWVLQNFDGLSI